jgi:hypothetical protein
VKALPNLEYLLTINRLLHLYSVSSAGVDGYRPYVLGRPRHQEL